MKRTIVATKASLGLGNVDNVASQPLLMNGGDLVTISGSPSGTWVAGSGVTDRVFGWLLDATAVEAVGALAVVPPGWATVNVALHWANSATSSGDVRWRINYTDTADGGSLTTNTAVSVTATAPATANVMKRTTLASGVAVTAGDLLTLRLARDAADAADTLTVDAAVIALVITRAS